MKLFLNKNRWPLSLTLLGLISGFSYFFSANTYQRSEYYAAIPHSMSMSLANFFFGSLDPAGTITLDKIPGSYWIPAIFVKIFGFHTWSIIVPNGLATIATVIVVALTGKSIAQSLAIKLADTDAPTINPELIGFIAGALIAVTPIITAVARSNQPESFFVLLMALAMHRAVIALQTGSRKQLIFAGLFIAGAFQMYMIEAWAVWPALIIAWFFVADKKFFAKAFDLLVAGTISLVSSLLWIIVVSLTPASARPYIGGTYTNSAWEMVFGYNALGRFTSTSNSNAYRSFTPPFSGTAGWTRLFNQQVAGQIAWFIIPAAVALILLLVRRQFNATVAFVGLTFVVFFAEFSLVSGMHQFYTAALALPMALVLAYFLAVAQTWMKLLVGASAVVSAIVFAQYYSGYFSLMPYLAAVALGAMVILAVFMERSRGLLVATLALVIGITPAAWSFDAYNHPSSINPIAGPDTGMGGFGGPGGFGAQGQLPGTGNQNINPRWGNQQGGPTVGGGATFGMTAQGEADSKALVAYLKKNITGTPKYLVAVFGAQASAPIINTTGASVMPIGGFDGSDPAPSLAQFIKYVNNKDVQYVVYGARDGGNGSFAGNNTSVFGPGAQFETGMNPNGQVGPGDTSAIATWVTSHCKLVDSAQFSNLYHCVPATD